MTKEQFAHLTKNFPDLQPRGLTLFLGRHYAHTHPSIMMLGINPGLDDDLPVDCDLQCCNCLLGCPKAPEARRIRHWRNARRCFGATPSLLAVMEWATFSFCSPFRTPRWSRIPTPQREAIEVLSRPILKRMLEDCRPSAVILAGRLAVPFCARIGNVSLVGRTTPEGGRGARTWTKFLGHAAWGEFDVLQVPHFSVFNSLVGLQECGEWLTSVLCQRAP
jgi:hypothetical protein